MNFLGFARAFFIRRNPFKALAGEFVGMLKEFLAVNKKLKVSRYRLNYHRHQLNKMETLIAQSNEHMFLKGRNINELR